MDNTQYTIVGWPYSQQYMDEAWFDEDAYLVYTESIGESATYAIPSKYVNPDIYIMVDTGDGNQNTFDALEDIQQVLDEWNENHETNYRTIEEFNDGEEFWKIYKVNF